MFFQLKEATETTSHGNKETNVQVDGGGDQQRHHVVAPMEIIEPDKSAKLIRKLQRKILRQQRRIDRIAEEDYEHKINRSDCDVTVDSNDEKSSSTEDSDSELVFKAKMDDLSL